MHRPKRGGFKTHSKVQHTASPVIFPKGGCQLVDTLIDIFMNTPPWLTVLVISLLPMVGLHVGFAVAALLSVPWTQAVVLTIIGNILPVPFILLFIRAVLKFMSNTPGLSGIAKFFEGKAMSKIQELVEKYPKHVSFGLFVFVAVPLPASGAWTGSLVAALMRMPIRRSFPTIVLGVCAACIIMLLLVYGFPAVMNF